MLWSYMYNYTYNSNIHIYIYIHTYIHLYVYSPCSSIVDVASGLQAGLDIQPTSVRASQMLRSVCGCGGATLALPVPAGTDAAAGLPRRS